MRPKCFVAMAFERDDTDEVYDKVIKPTIESVGFDPRVVNRINHNDDIDDRIFKELDDCLLCVADLTYTRPSVYYEAGYARARGVPVVHTARTDHLNQKNSDDQRVHFDLQMKNIIDWGTPDDSKFPGRLKTRLMYVSKSLRVKLASDQMRKHERDTFAQSSVDTQIDLLERVLCGELLRRGYRRTDSDDTRPTYNLRIGDCEHFVGFEFRHRITTKDIKEKLDPYRIPEECNTCFAHLMIYICMNSVRKPTLASFLSSFHPDLNLKRFRKRCAAQVSPKQQPNRTIVAVGSRRPTRLLPMHIHEIAVLDAPKSGNDALESLDEILDASVFDAKRLLSAATA